MVKFFMYPFFNICVLFTGKFCLLFDVYAVTGNPFVGGSVGYFSFLFLLAGRALTVVTNVFFLIISNNIKVNVSISSS